MSMKTIYELYTSKDETVYDLKLGKKLRKAVHEFIHKSPDSIAFFSNTGVGYNFITFHTKDVNEVLDNVFDANFVHNITPELKKLPNLDMSRRVASNPIHLFFIYAMYRVFKTNLNLEDKIQMVEDIFFIYASKRIGYMLTVFFGNHKLSKDKHDALVENMKGKYILKQCGSWLGYIKYRAKDVVPKNKYTDNKVDGIRYMRIMKPKDNDEVGATAADIDGRFKSTFKFLYVDVLKLIAENKSHKHNSLLIEGDDGSVLRDVISDTRGAVEKIHRNITDKHSFINPSLISVIAGDDKRSKTILSSSLDYLIKKIDNHKIRKEFSEVIESCVVEVLSVIDKKANEQKNLMDKLTAIRNAWRSNPHNNKDIKDAKKLFEIILKKDLKLTNNKIILLSVTNIGAYIISFGVLKG